MRTFDRVLVGALVLLLGGMVAAALGVVGPAQGSDGDLSISRWQAGTLPVRQEGPVAVQLRDGSATLKVRLQNPSSTGQEVSVRRWDAGSVPVTLKGGVVAQLLPGGDPMRVAIDNAPASLQAVSLSVAGKPRVLVLDGQSRRMALLAVGDEGCDLLWSEPAP